MYQKIAIVRSPQDSLTFEDDEGKKQSISVEEIGDAIATAVSETIFECYQQADDHHHRHAHTQLSLLDTLGCPKAKTGHSCSKNQYC